MLVLPLIATALVTQLTSQTIKGRVIDALSQEPVAYAIVEVTFGTAAPTRAITDTSGFFAITLRQAPQARVVARVRRIGYQSENHEFTARPDILETIPLQRIPTELAGLSVTSSSVPRLRKAGFYERAHSGFGHFITEEIILDRQPRNVSDLFRSIPGVSVSPSPRGPGSNDITMTRARARLRAGPCRPKVVVDGRVVASPSDATFDLDSYVTPEEITGVEIYRGPSETPAAFGGAESACGVIVIWTK